MNVHTIFGNKTNNIKGSRVMVTDNTGELIGGVTVSSRQPIPYFRDHPNGAKAVEFTQLLRAAFRDDDSTPEELLRRAVVEATPAPAPDNIVELAGVLGMSPEQLAGIRLSNPEMYYHLAYSAKAHCRKELYISHCGGVYNCHLDRAPLSMSVAVKDGVTTVHGDGVLLMSEQTNDAAVKIELKQRDRPSFS
ncbi:MAG: hypothetical protein ACPGF7_09360 [Pontibacterium sp.]